MTLTKLSNSKHRALDPWMGNVFDTLFNEPFIDARASFKTPAVNISETDKSYEIELAAPGLKKEDLQIQVEEGLLSISFERKAECAKEEKRYTKREFSIQSFKRSFNLPDNTNTEEIRANYEDGVLSVEIAKKAEEKPQKRTIEVK